MKKPNQLSFSQFLDFFPVVAAPITLGEDTHHIFSRQNRPLPTQAIDQYLVPIEDREGDEFTEFVPCFSLESSQPFYAIVYWRAGLLSYYYVLATFDNRGNFIDKRIIAGSHFGDGEMTRSVALFTETHEIVVASGQEALSASREFGAADSTAYNLVFTEDGHIVNE